MRGVGDGWRSQPTCWTHYFSNHAFFYQKPVLYPLFLVSNRHCRMKCISGKPSFKTSVYELNTLIFYLVVVLHV